MTCIVAIVDGTSVWMGADSASSTHDIVMTSKVDKLFELGGMLIGVAGSWRANQILRYHTGLPSRTEIQAQDPMLYMVQVVVPAYRSAMEEHAGRYQNRSQDWQPGECLVAYAGRLFAISQDFHVNEAQDGHDAIGSGEAVARGSLHATGLLVKGRPDLRIRLALEAAEAATPFTRKPFSIRKFDFSVDA